LHGRGDRVRMTFDRILSGKGHRDILDDGRREIASKRGMGVLDGNGGEGNALCGGVRCKR
jgi:hypothetical protein